MDVVGTAAGHPAVRGLVDDFVDAFLIDEGFGKTATTGLIEGGHR